MKLNDLKIVNRSKLVYNNRVVATFFGQRARHKGAIVHSNHGYVIDGERFDGFCYRDDAIRQAKLDVLERHNAGTLKGEVIVKALLNRPVSVYIGATKMSEGIIIDETTHNVVIRTPTGTNAFSKNSQYKVGGRRYGGNSVRFSYAGV